METLAARIERLNQQIRWWTDVTNTKTPGTRDHNAAKKMVRSIKKERDQLIGGKRKEGGPCTPK